MDISNQGLTSIPQNIPLDTTNLNLCCNSLTYIPAQAFSPSLQVTMISLSQNQIASFHPEAFMGLDKLTSLLLDHNLLMIIPTNAFQGVPSLEHLNLCHNPIDTIEPDAFESLTSVISFDICNTQIKQLPVGVFPKIPSGYYVIDLDDNKLNFLPAGIFSGLYVSGLHLKNNEISALPEGGFRDLKVHYFVLENNKITYIPANAFSHIQGLLHLYLGGNQIAEIHPSAFQTVELELISLEDNKLDCISEDVFNQVSWLNYGIPINRRNQPGLILTNNNLTTIPPNIKTPYVGLDSNPIECNAICWVGLEFPLVSLSVECGQNGQYWDQTMPFPHLNCPPSPTCTLAPSGESIVFKLSSAYQTKQNFGTCRPVKS